MAGGRSETTRGPAAFEIVLHGHGADETLLVETRTGVIRATDDGDASLPRVLCFGDVLLRVAAGELNLAQAAHDGLVRVANSTTGGPVRAARDLLTLLDSLLQSEPPPRGG